MNQTEFVEKALQWQKLQEQLKELEKELAPAFVELFGGKKQTIAKFEVKHQKGRTTYDYEETWYTYHHGVDPGEEYIKRTFDFKKAVDEDDVIEEILIKSVGEDKVVFTYLG